MMTRTYGTHGLGGLARGLNHAHYSIGALLASTIPFLVKLIAESPKGKNDVQGGWEEAAETWEQWFRTTRPGVLGTGGSSTPQVGR